MSVSRTPDEFAVLSVISKFSATIAANPQDTLTSLLNPAGSVIRTNMENTGGALIYLNLGQLVEYISGAGIEKDIEGRFDPNKATVKVDGNLGIVWAPWTSYKDGKVSHSGTLLFVLAREGKEGKWIIQSNADTLR